MLARSTKTRDHRGAEARSLRKTAYKKLRKMEALIVLGLQTNPYPEITKEATTDWKNTSQPATSSDGLGFIQGSPASREAWEDDHAQLTGVHDQNGRELEVDELALRQWE